MLVALVFVQVFHAGFAVLVDAGNWTAHRNLGNLFSLPVFAMGILSLIGWMPVRFFLMSLLLFGLYVMQYIFLYAMPQSGAPALTALHPVNALVIGFTGYTAVRGAWHLVAEAWPAEAKARRGALGLAAAACAVLAVSVGLRTGTWAFAGDNGGSGVSLAASTESSVPAPYLAMQNPFGDGAGPGPAAAAAGEQIAQQRCIVCHAPEYKGKQLGAVRSADLTASAHNRSAQFLMWAISEGGQGGMPAWKNGLTEEQRWQLVTFIKSLKQ
jgi:mono/diheme cytochrome c family protein